MERNRFLYRCLALLLLLCCFGVGEMRGGDDRYDRNASGKMFSLKDVNGNTIRYYIISDTAVHVVNKATSGDYYVWKNSGDDSKAYKGDIVIPETVTHPDTKKKYKVTGLWCLNDSNGTFDQCTQLRSVYLPKYIEKIFITSMFSYCYNLRYVVINSKFKGFHGGVEKYPNELYDDGRSWVYKQCDKEGSGHDVRLIYYVNKNSGMTETDRDKWIKWSNVDHACWYQFDGPLDVGVYKYHLDESSQTAKIYYFRSEYSDSINPRSGDFRIPAQTVASYEGTGSWKSEYTNAKYSKIYDVISIEENAFNASIKIANYIRWIRSVDFSKATNLTSIGGSAFSCNRSPFLSDSLIFAGNTDLHIGYLSFENKNSIKKVRIGRNITGWGENNDAFALHGGIDTLILEGNCKTIGKKAFISKTIKYLKIDAPLNWEGEGGGISGDCGAFNGCNISKLELTNRLTKFGIGSFYNAKGEGIDSVFIPNTITDFGRNIFENSTLRVLKFEEGLKEITSTNDGCFANSNKLEKIYFPSTLEKIDKNSFKDCSALKELVIPSSVLSIGDYAFYNTRLSDSLILVGNNDLCIGRDVFNNNATSIKKIRIGRNITGWSGSRDQFVFSRIDTLILEGNFKTIGAYAFQDTKIDFLKIDVNIDWGDGHTFENTTSGSENGVKKLVLGEKFNECTSIGAYVFAWNQKMESDIDLSKLRNLTIIKNRAFYQCGNNNNKGKISVISLPRSVKTIEENAFYDVKCDSVKIQDLKDWCKIDFANGHSAPFYANGKSQASLFVDTSKNYEGKYVCQDEEMIIPADVNKIGQYAFDGYKKLKSAILPNKIDTIGKSVFENCDSLNTIIWLGNKKNFDYKEKTFSGSKKVSRTLYLRDSNFVREVKGKSGFCDSIDVVRPLVLGTIENKSGENTFFYKKTGKASCQTIAIPDTIQKLEMRCWGPSFVERYDTTIEGGTKEIKGELSIPKDVTVGESTYKVNFIGDTSFKNAKGIISVSFEKLPDSIGAGAFAGDSFIQKLDVPNYNGWAKMRLKDSASNPVYAYRGVPKFYTNGKQMQNLSFSVDTIRPFTFYNLRSLTNISFDTKLNCIEEKAFWNCNLSSEKNIKDINSRTDSVNLAIESLRLTPPELNKEAFSIKFLKAPDDIVGDSARKVFERENNVICMVMNESAQKAYRDNDNEWGKHFYIKDFSANSITCPYGDSILINLIVDGESDPSRKVVKQLVFTKITESSGSDTLGTCKLISRANAWDTTGTGGYIGYLAEHNFYRRKDGKTDTATWNGTSLVQRKPGKIVIPDTFSTNDKKKYKVIGIYDGTFAKCIDLDTIVLKDEYHDMKNYNIEDNAFDSCVNLCKVNLPKVTDTIGNNAFLCCSKIDTINIPGTLKYVGYGAFDGPTLKKMDSLIFPSSIEEIREGAFYKTQIKNIHIPQCSSKYLSIRDEAFAGCDSLRSLQIETSNYKDEGIVFIGDYAFEGDSLLGKITLGNNVHLANEGIFKHCSKLDSIYLPMYLATIGDSVFLECDSLKVVVVNEGLEEIGKGAFYKCYNIEKVKISNLVNWCKIDFDRFGSPLTEGGYYQRTDTASIGRNRKTNKPAYLYLMGVPGNPDTIITDLVIPNEVKELKSRAFEEYQELKSVRFHNGVTSIKDYAFRGAQKLDSVICFGKNPAKLGEDVFLWNSDKKNDKELSKDTSHAKLYVRDRVAKHCYEQKEKWRNAFSYYGKDDVIGTSDYAQKGIKNMSDTLDNYVFEYESLFYRIDSINEDRCEVCRKCKILEDAEGKYRDSVIIEENAIDSSKNDNDEKCRIVSIADSAFAKCNELNYLEIKAENKDTTFTIGTGAFSGATALKKMKVWSYYPPKLTTKSGTFATVEDGGNIVDTLYVRDKKSKGIYEKDGGNNRHRTYEGWGGHFTTTQWEGGKIISRVVALSNSYIYYDGIYYDTINSSQQVKAVYNNLSDGNTKSTDYHGKIFIPDSFLYQGDGMKYYVVEIGDKAFFCNDITSVEIPKSVTKIGASAFDKCNKLDSVTCWGNPTPSLSEPEGDQGVFRGKSSTANLYVDNITFKNKYENSAWNHYFDANHIVAIGKYHFIKNGVCYHIEDGNSNVYVARPSKNTFYAKDIDVPEKVTNDSSIYLKGTKWEEIQTYNVIGVQDSAFAKIDTSGNSITLPKTITYWGGGCFAPIIKDSVCKSIGVLYIKALKPNKDSVKLGKLFGDTSSIKGTFHTTLKVNDNISKEWFENTLKWKNSGNKRDYFKNIVVANSCDIERDGVWYVLNDSSKPEDSTLKVIKRSDGKLYSGDIVLPDRLPYIDGEYYTVTKIDSLAFRDCTGLTSIDIGDSIQWILNGAFKNCTGLTNLYIGNPDKWATKTLGDYLSNPMYYAHKFKVRGAKRATTDLTLSTPIIKDNTFSGCSDLKRVTFTPEVKDIGSRVFDWCNNLEEVYCMHKDWNLIPDLNVGMKTHVFSSNLKNNKTKLYAISDIWTKQPNKCWDHYFDIMDAVYIYYGEGGNEIVPYSKIKVSSKNCQIKVSGANDVQILDTNGNLIDKMSGNGEGELISKTLSKGGYIVLAETKDASYYEKVLVQ